MKFSLQLSELQNISYKKKSKSFLTLHQLHWALTVCWTLGFFTVPHRDSICSSFVLSSKNLSPSSIGVGHSQSCTSVRRKHCSAFRSSKKKSINWRTSLYKDLRDQSIYWGTSVWNCGHEHNKRRPATVWSYWMFVKWRTVALGTAPKKFKSLMSWTVSQSPARNHVNILEQLSPVCLERQLSNCLLH